MNISFSYFALLKHIRNSMKTVSLNKRLQKCLSIALMILVNAHESHRYLSTPHLRFIIKDLIRNKYFMTISIFALKGELNGRTLLQLRFFFVGYSINTLEDRLPVYDLIIL